MTAHHETRARAFARLHDGPTPLLLPNAWDVTSALAFARAGHLAVGTTSFGVAASDGRPDGGRATRDSTLALATALRHLPIPLSVDIEDGYHDDPAAVADDVAALAHAGAVGVNMEDSTAEALIEPARHAAKIAAIKDRCPAVFLNARVDTYWLGQDATPEHTLARAEAYVRAGADGVFLPGLTDPAVLREATRTLPVPVNTLVVPGLTLGQLADLGVRRVSTGSLPYRAAIHAALDVASAVRDGRTPPPGIPYSELQTALVDHTTR
ncbi:MAG: isocitrate lyase/phosphoenolpyruvate mutase family protein [Pseudonocardia sp.]|jgi:2-methylisocitrate lyase-like PEP mutase family enzyme|uniref:isocitrate lyase/PEP mutase family protein n=1 Tax=Pseudonocardia sp. TaxID=60912 RepID=UPI001ACB9ABE|nr:isocitrate lyase/phosphoenolpyruvate mutase family protein [Pseudonocardia sp.]MBN9096786.1 isocitrate lyase/phosphoenolpyruvate mutase family protein [Pseudonocardia sp.]